MVRRENHTFSALKLKLLKFHAPSNVDVYGYYTEKTETVVGDSGQSSQRMSTEVSAVLMGRNWLLWGGGLAHSWCPSSAPHPTAAQLPPTAVPVKQGLSPPKSRAHLHLFQHAPGHNQSPSYQLYLGFGLNLL